MPFRIDRIKVNRGGPLKTDFDFEPGDLNLVYGRNETGKTYLVESLIRFLFNTGGKAPVAAGLRLDWDVAGKVIVSGLESDPVSFTKSGRKLEDYWENGTGFPGDLSRLLVVRAGDTLLAESPTSDGVGRDLLKDYLSGEGLLDKVADRISLTLKGAKVQDRLIVGNQAGEVKSREKRKARLDDLQSLLEDMEEGYASGDAYLLQQQKDSLAARVETLQRARRYHAEQLAGQIQALKSEKSELPSERELANLEQDVTVCEATEAKIQTKAARLTDLESTSADFAWAQQAQGIYDKAMSGPGGSGPKPILLVIALLLLVGTVASGLLGLTIPLILCGVGLAAAAGGYVVQMNRAFSNAGQTRELSDLKDQYQGRFGSDLSDRATLNAKVEELRENDTLTTPLKKDLDELSDAARALEMRIADTLKTWTGGEVSESDWREAIRDLTRKGADVEDRTDSIREKLNSAGVPADEYLDEDPGELWDPDRYAELTEEHESAEYALSEQKSELDELKARVSQETGLTNSDTEELIAALRKIREEAAEDYRQITAENLAKIQVFAVVEELRKQENRRIAEGLERPELTEPLRALTGHYQSIRHDNDEGLILSSDSDDEYPLADMSTGVREQVFLALRMGFASIAMEGETGFLILDDAFQHSDWNRRKNLVEHTLSFVQRGWQVFYFTMDDHIRDLFQDTGASLGDRFRSCELG
jgi:uncharacterized protein YhaN